MEFLAHYCHTSYFQRTCFHSSHGVDVEKMIFKINEWLEREVDLPPVVEQRKIAAILASVDEAIGAAQAVVEQLGVVKKEMMADLLHRGGPGRHARLKQTDVGEVSEDWDVVALSDVAVVQTGIAKGKPAEDGVELSYLRVANVHDGRVDLTEVKKITVERGAVQRYALRHGDVLFTEGGDADKLGRGCVWEAQVSPCLHQNHVFAVRPDPARLLPQFLAYWAASPGGKAYFLGCAKQTTNLASINSTQLKALPVPLPSLEEQREIVAAIRAVDDRRSADAEALSGLLSAKFALSAALLTGDLRVAPGQAPV
jgi:type I restriction enzyme S subunit